MQYHKNVQLKEYNSFRTEALAKIFCTPQSIEDVQQCVKEHAHEEILIIGGGCNLFFTKDYDGLVIVLDLKGKKVVEHLSDEEHIYIEAMASEEWDNFVSFCVENHYSGLENLSLIPGTIGASPVQNIGAYGAEVGDCIVEVKAVDKKTGELLVFSKEECQFGYRDSLFKRSGEYIIISVLYKLAKQFHYTPKYIDLNKELEDVEEPTMKEVREAVLRVRKRKLPDEKELPNAGSFFKNPYISSELADKIQEQYPNLPRFPQADGNVKTSAAFLIDRAGYKGKRNGYIGTYPNQALIIVNYGSTNGNDIISFMHEIQVAVKQAFSIELEPEVRIF